MIINVIVVLVLSASTLFHNSNISLIFDGLIITSLGLGLFFFLGTSVGC